MQNDECVLNGLGLAMMNASGGDDRFGLIGPEAIPPTYASYVAFLKKSSLTT